MLHSKKVAKQKRKDDSLTGNKIDKCFSAMNHDQTNGILIGNAISRIFSEIILCSVDKKIQDKFKNIMIARYVMITIYIIKDAAQIQNIISFISNELGEYELILNENKMRIYESPFTFSKHWIEEIKLFLHVESDVFSKQNNFFIC